MKHICDVILDLLPLYIDGCCSEASRRMVEEHLAECPNCKREWQEAAGELPDIPKVSPAEELPEGKPARVMKKGLKKIYRRWIASLLIVILLIPVGFLSWNEYWRSGVCFTNLNDLWIAHSFMRDLQRGDYEAALGHWELAETREYFSERWFDEETLASFEEDAKEYFLAGAQQIIDAGGITDYRFTHIEGGAGNDNGDKFYRIYGTVTIGGTVYDMQLSVGNDGVYSWAGNGSLPDPDPPTALGLWGEYLWEHYAGCYLDFDLHEYVFYD